MVNRKLNSIKFPDIADTYILDADKVNFDDSETYASGSVGKALQNKANIDGSYSDLTAGNAEQLVSNVRVNDKTPYLFRTSGGSVDIGDREYVNGIVGGTVAWNQLVQNGNFASNTGWSTNGGTKSVANNVLTLTSTVANNVGIYQSVSTINGHKYLLTSDIKITSSASTVNMRWVLSDGGSGTEKSAGSIPSGTKTTSSVIVSPASNWSRLYILSPYSGSGMAVGDKIEFSNFMCIDLTQMFGSTIADYIYSLETATAGAGVAWFKKLFNKPYYAYNAGELKSVSGLVSHDMTGFNQFDKSTVESGKWFNNESGVIADAPGYNLSDYIRIMPNTTYYCAKTGSIRSLYFDENKNLIYTGSWAGVASSGGTFTTPSNVAYIRMTVGNGEIDNFVLNISWDGSRNGEYEPYLKHSYPLDSDLTLRGIPKLDANNNLYYDGDIYAPSGEVTRKYGIVDLGTLNWTAGTDAIGQYFMSSAINDKKGAPSQYYDNIVCSKYTTTGSANVADKQIAGSTGTSHIVYVRDTAYTDATAFKTAMNGVYLVYELATQTTETADAYVGTQIVNDFGTEEYVISDNTFAVPVGHDTDYPVNLVAKLEMAPNSPEGNGDYIVRQTNGTNEYVPLVIEDALPTIPSTAGSYKLTVTVTEGSDPVLSWEAE